MVNRSGGETERHTIEALAGSEDSGGLIVQLAGAVLPTLVGSTLRHFYRHRNHRQHLTGLWSAATVRMVTVLKTVPAK